MTNLQRDLPALDDMLSSLLLIEEGEHEFTGADEVSDIRQLFFPVTRTCIYLNHAANGPLPRPVVTTMHEYIENISLYGGTQEERWREYERGRSPSPRHYVECTPRPDCVDRQHR